MEESSEQRRKRLAAERQRRQRAKMTEDEKFKVRAINAAANAARRARETLAETQRRREADVARVRAAKAAQRLRLQRINKKK